MVGDLAGNFIPQWPLWKAVFTIYPGQIGRQNFLMGSRSFMRYFRIGTLRQLPRNNKFPSFSRSTHLG